MDYNAMFRSLCLAGREDSQVWLRKFFDLPPPDLPEPVVEKIIWKHLGSEPIHRIFELRRVCKHFQSFLAVPKFLKVQESWILKQNCVPKDGNIVTLDTYNVPDKKRQLIPVPSGVPLRELICIDELRVSSSQGGEGGLIYLEKGESSASNTPTRECFVFNPMTRSVRQLRLHSSVRQVDRFSSGYLSWDSILGGEEMRPLLLDPLTDTWNEIGSGFVTRGQIRKEKAVVNEVVYLRYQRGDLKDLLIIYDIHQKTFEEVRTTGLADNMVNENLFYHKGHIYLAAVLSFPPTGRSMPEKDVLLYELKSTNSRLNWESVSEIPSNLLHELTDTYPDLSKLKFFYMDHELLVASLVTKRRSDGARVFLDGARPRCPKCYPCHAIVAYDLTSDSWRKDTASRLGPNLDTRTVVFRPRLDIEA